jgi:hypothetical protein
MTLSARGRLPAYDCDAFEVIDEEAGVVRLTADTERELRQLRTDLLSGQIAYQTAIRDPLHTKPRFGFGPRW